METLSREQILDLLARAEAKLMRIRISRQPQLLKKPLGLLRQADSACRDVLPRQVYEAKCQQFLLTLSQALEQAILFLSYVPTLDCETFDLEALHPDIIFIHNPYDIYNQFTVNPIQFRLLDGCPKPLDIRGFGDSSKFPISA